MTARPSRIVVATRNPGKLAEIRAGLLSESLAIELLSLLDFPESPEVEESGATYEENARLKALSALRATGLPSLADDTGLEVDALSGAPGLKSGRFSGPAQDARSNREKLLHSLSGVALERRTARFRCVLVLAEPGERGEAPRLTRVEGTVEGRIADSPRGMGGFGYDALFLVQEMGLTMAELSLADKNRISHRGVALARLRTILARRT